MVWVWVARLFRLCIVGRPRGTGAHLLSLLVSIHRLASSASAPRRDHSVLPIPFADSAPITSCRPWQCPLLLLLVLSRFIPQPHSTLGHRDTPPSAPTPVLEPPPPRLHSCHCSLHVLTRLTGTPVSIDPCAGGSQASYFTISSGYGRGRRRKRTTDTAWRGVDINPFAVTPDLTRATPCDTAHRAIVSCRARRSRERPGSTSAGADVISGWRITPIQQPITGAAFMLQELARIQLMPILIVQIDCWDPELQQFIVP